MQANGIRFNRRLAYDSLELLLIAELSDLSPPCNHHHHQSCWSNVILQPKAAADWTLTVKGEWEISICRIFTSFFLRIFNKVLCFILYSIALSFSIYYLFRKKLKENKYTVLSFNFLIFFPSLVSEWVPWGLQRWMNARLLRWGVVVAMIRHELWIRVAKLCRLGRVRIIPKPNKWVGDKNQELVHKQTVEAWRRLLYPAFEEKSAQVFAIHWWSQHCREMGRHVLIGLGKVDNTAHAWCEWNSSVAVVLLCSSSYFKLFNIITCTAQQA